MTNQWETKPRIDAKYTPCISEAIDDMAPVESAENRGIHSTVLRIPKKPSQRHPQGSTYKKRPPATITTSSGTKKKHKMIKNLEQVESSDPSDVEEAVAPSQAGSGLGLLAKVKDI